MEFHAAEDSAERRRDYATWSAREDASAIDSQFELYPDINDEGYIDDKGYDEEFVDTIQTARRAWRDLRERSGFDLADILRRRQLVPFINIPKLVSNANGVEQAISLLTNLQDAQQAFIFGAPLAALAMLRATMESVLRSRSLSRKTVNASDGASLANLIDGAKLPLPLQKDLRLLKDLANAVLHVNDLEFRRLLDPSLKVRDVPEQVLINGFIAVRTLIERSASGSSCG